MQTTDGRGVDRAAEEDRMKEVDLAKKVVEWLIDQRWDVYQEVSP